MQGSNLWWLETEASYRRADRTAASRTPRRPRRRPSFRFPSPATTSRVVGREHRAPGPAARTAPALQHVSGEATMGFRVILTTGLATLYVAGCLAALSLLISMWGYSV